MKSDTTVNRSSGSRFASGPAGPGPGAGVGAKTQAPRVAAVLLAVVAAFILLASAAGCSDAQVQQYRAANAELKAALDETNNQLADNQALIAQLDDQIAATPDGPEKQAAVEARDRVAALAEKARVYAEKLTVAVQRSDAVISAALAGNTADAVDIGGRYAASQLPGPYGVYVLAGTSILGGVLTWMQKRKTDQAQTTLKYTSRDLDFTRANAQRTRDAAESVITAIEHEKVPDGTVNFADPSTKISLRSRMSSEARRMVDDIRRSLPARPKAAQDAHA